MGLLRVIIIIIAVTVVMKYLTSDVNKKVDTDIDGFIALRSSKLYIILGAISIILGVFLIFIFYDRVKANELPYFIGFVLIFIMCGIFFIVSYCNSKIIFSKDTIISYGVFYGRKEIQWSEINEVSYSVISMNLKLKTDSTKICVSIYTVGFNKLLDMMSDTVNGELSRDAIYKIRKAQENINNNNWF